MQSIDGDNLCALTSDLALDHEQATRAAVLFVRLYEPEVYQAYRRLKQQPTPWNHMIFDVEIEKMVDRRKNGLLRGHRGGDLDKGDKTVAIDI